MTLPISSDLRGHRQGVLELFHSPTGAVITRLKFRQTSRKGLDRGVAGLAGRVAEVNLNRAVQFDVQNRQPATPGAEDGQKLSRIIEVVDSVRSGGHPLLAPAPAPFGLAHLGDLGELL